MKAVKTKPSVIRPPLLRRLDYLPVGIAVVLGVITGALLGACFALGPLPVAGIGFVMLLGGAVALAYSGEPITVLMRPGERRAQATEPEIPPGPVSGIAPDMVAIPAGTFLMGSPEDEEGRDDNEGPVHEAWISAFACMRFPVTRRLYQAVLGEDPGRPSGEADERPVNNVSWHDAIRFCNRLSEREGLTLCYTIDENGGVSWDRTADGYRLLTEAEWEYACRAGTQTRWSCGDDEKDLERYAWFAANAKDAPQPVGQKEANRWGLYDMHGNVREWCWDWYGSYSA
jgi:formylglycine-generating enzyme required for sulfatase activity